DGHGNTSTQTQTVIVLKDAIPPMLACPPDAVITNGLQILCGFNQNGWNGSPNTTVPGAILVGFFSYIYPTGLEIGISGGAGHSMRFTSGVAVQNYLPGSGSTAALSADLVNPTNSSSGIFGAQVLALQLNVDFGDAGSSVGLVGSIGNLVLNDPSSPM